MKSDEKFACDKISLRWRKIESEIGYFGECLIQPVSYREFRVRIIQSLNFQDSIYVGLRMNSGQ